MNQLYNQAVKRGYKGTFADFAELANQMKSEKLIAETTFRNDIAGPAPSTAETTLANPESSFKFKWQYGVAALIILVVLGYMIMNRTKTKKEA